MKIHRGCALRVTLLGLAWLVTAGVAAQDVQLTPYASSPQALTGAISPDGLVRLTLSPGTTTGSAVARLLEFTGSDGRVLNVVFEDGGGKERTLNVGHDPILLGILAAEAAAGATYTGELWVKVGTAPVKTFTLRLSRTPPEHYVATPRGAPQAMVASVPDDGALAIHFDVRDLRQRATQAMASVEAFSGQDGRAAQVRVLSPQVALDADFVSVQLDASDLPLGTPFTGVVALRAEDAQSLAYVELTRRAASRTADPTIVPKSVALAVTCGLFRCSKSRQFVNVNEEGFDEPLQALYVTPGTPPTEPADATVLQFDKLEVRSESGSRPSLLTLDPTNRADVEARTLGSKGQELVSIALVDIDPKPGLYKTTLRFGAMNANVSQFDDVAVTLRVERPWWWALCVLTLGVLASWWATKGVAAMKRRSELSKRIEDLSRDEGLRRDHEGTGPIVQMRAHIAKLRAAMKTRYWFSVFAVPSVVVKEIEQIEGQLPYLGRLSACVDYWSNRDGFVARRARKTLRVLVKKLHDVPLSADPKVAFEDQIAAMEQWQNDAALPQRYVEHLKKDVTELLAHVDPTQLGTGHPFEAEVVRLSAVIQSQISAATTRATGEALERSYSALKLLWDNRGDPKLVERLLSESKRGVEAMFDLVDGAVWERFLAQDAPLAISESEPAGIRDSELGNAPVGDAVEVFQLVTFKVHPAKRLEGDNFLFKHGLEFAWRIEFPGRSTLTPITHEPRVTQFVPVVCKDAKVSVTVRYRRSAQALTPKPGWISTKASDEFKATEVFSRSDVVAVVLALIFAVATGFSSEYLEPDLLGSAGDFLKLFLWGVGADQVKNFIQTLAPQP